jgi:hypothetical protein
MFSVKASAILNLLGLICSVRGGILLFYSLSLVPSSYSLVERTDHGVAICLNGKLVASGYGGALVVTNEPCPKGLGPVAPVIEAERPGFVGLRLGLIVVGFALQLPLGLIPLVRPT